MPCSWWQKKWNKIDYKNCASRWSLTHCNMMHGTYNVTLTHCNVMHGTHNVTLTHCNMMYGTHNATWWKLVFLRKRPSLMPLTNVGILVEVVSFLLLYTEVLRWKSEAGFMIDDSCSMTEDWRITLSLLAFFKEVSGVVRSPCRKCVS